MSDSEIHHLGAAYALDALDDRERAAFEAHATTCEICRTDVREFRATAAELAGMTATPPPAALRGKVLSEISTTRQLSPLPDAVVRLTDRRGSRPVMAAMAVAAAVACFVVGALVVGARGGDDFGDEVAAVLVDPGSQVARLSGEGAGSVTVVWNDDSAAVIGDGLAPLDDGLAYELWLIDGEGIPQPMRLLDRAEGGALQRIVPVDGQPAAWGVTVEPEGGSTAPTTDVIYAAPVTA